MKSHTLTTVHDHSHGGPGGCTACFMHDLCHHNSVHCM